VVTKERLLYAEENRMRYVTHVDIVGDKQPAALAVAKTKSDHTKIDGVVLEKPAHVQRGISLTRSAQCL
jgi:hypothetical protein